VKDGAVFPALDYPLCPAKKIVLFFHRKNPLLSKLGKSRWLDIGLVLFLKKNEVGQYPAI